MLCCCEACGTGVDGCVETGLDTGSEASSSDSTSEAVGRGGFLGGTSVFIVETGLRGGTGALVYTLPADLVRTGGGGGTGR